jgi:hypothetical protein
MFQQYEPIIILHAMPQSKYKGLPYVYSSGCGRAITALSEYNGIV